MRRAVAFFLLLVTPLSGCRSARPPFREQIIVPQIDTALVREKVMDQKEYLLRALDPRHHGIYKKYDARTDTAETKLRTIYTASTLLTLLKINDYAPDPRIDEQIKPVADFLLSMQVKDGPEKGSFYYSFDPETELKENRFVTGTASKTVFTMIELYQRTLEPAYLQSAKDAASWLVRKTDTKGHVTPEVRIKKNGLWAHSTKTSYLYSCQVLTALSRLYLATKDETLLAPAQRIAQNISADVQKKKYFAGDDFRRRNTISTSWAVLAFFTYSKIDPEPVYKDLVKKCTEEILNRQIKDPSRPLDYGRFADTAASSGNGWINEVLTELYASCLEERQSGCQTYFDAILKTTRWLVQNIYSYQNTTRLPNPDRARGGAIRNRIEESVRTDAVCHGANSFVRLLTLAQTFSFKVPGNPGPAASNR